MAWVVDSCVILDVAIKDPHFGYSSALFLDKHRDEGLVACPVTVIESAPEFGGDLSEVKRFLTLAGIEPALRWMDGDTQCCVGGWSR